MSEQPPSPSGIGQEDPAFLFLFPSVPPNLNTACVRAKNQQLCNTNEMEREILKMQVLHMLCIHSLIAETTKNGLFNRILLVHEESYNYNPISLR